MVKPVDSLILYGKVFIDFLVLCLKQLDTASIFISVLTPLYLNYFIYLDVMIC